MFVTLKPLQEKSVMTPQVAPTNTNAATSMAAKSDLPEWLHDAAPKPVSRGYGSGMGQAPVVSPQIAQAQPQASQPQTNQPQANQLQVNPSNAAQISQPIQVAQANSEPVNAVQNAPQGEVLRQRLNQQASHYMQAQRHTLSAPLQSLTQIPPAGSPEYASWVQQVAEIVHQAGFTSTTSVGHADSAATYVFEEPQVTKLLQMLPVTALRDVIRGAGKLSRRVAAQDALVRSQGASQQVQAQSQQLHQSLNASPETANFRAETQQDNHRSNVASRSAPNMAAPIAPSLATASPTTANRAAERDVRALARKRTSGGLAVDKPALEQAQRQAERADVQMRNFDFQQRSAETETLRQGQAAAGGFAESFEAAPVTQKPATSATAAQMQRQEQLMRIAKRIRAQVTMQVLRQAQSENETVELQLNPRRLGKMSVQLVREASHKMVINFAIENPETLDALRDNVDSLLQSLQEAGINTDRGAMNFTLKEENRQAFEQKQKKTGGSDGAEEDEEALLEMGQVADIDGDGHVNVRV